MIFSFFTRLANLAYISDIEYEVRDGVFVVVRECGGNRERFDVVYVGPFVSVPLFPLPEESIAVVPEPSFSFQ